MTTASSLESVFRRLIDVSADADGFRVTPAIDNLAILAAVDPSGRRHLLARVPADAPVVPDERSAGIHVLRRELIEDGRPAWFVDVASGGTGFNELFTIVADEILAAWAETTSSRPDIVANSVVARWRDLLAKPSSSRGLTVDELIGLIGELHVLRALGGNLDSWAGPGGGRHDFVGEAADVEVKSTRARAGLEVEIHSLDQLTAAPGTVLHLVFNRLEEVAVGGESVASLVDALIAAGVDSVSLVDHLASASATAELLDPMPRRYRLLEQHIYLVDESFPALSVGDIGKWPRPGVTYLHYGIDLASAERNLESTSLDEIGRAMEGADEPA